MIFNEREYPSGDGADLINQLRHVRLVPPVFLIIQKGADEIYDSTFEVGEKYIKRWLNKIGEEQFRRLLELSKADISAQNPLYKEERLNKVQKIEELLENILSEAQCFTLKDLAVNGNDVMKYMGCSGKIVGYWLNHLLDMVINGEIQNNPYELISYMKHANV